jgi:UDPglucose 6-dehydrogenase
VASNPEFLREGNAIEDCLKPNRVIIGVESQKAQEILTNLYEPFLKNGNPILSMDPASSEMTKYAANAMLAAKISLMNEFSRICEKVGADIESVRKGIGSDHRIGPHFIYAGVGYGGSCFPKDVSALVRSGRELNEDLMILSAVEKTNQLQRQRFITTIEKNLNVHNRCLAVWGVAFKPGTDDIREAPALDIIQYFLDQKFTIQVYDPVAADNAREYFKNNPGIKFFDDQYAALKDADALIIPTEWKSFREPDFPRMKTLMKHYMIFDGRNIYSKKYIKEQGFKYFSIGRPQ